MDETFDHVQVKADIHRTSMDKTFNNILNELTSIFTTTDETFKWPPKKPTPTH